MNAVPPAAQDAPAPGGAAPRDRLRVHEVGPRDGLQNERRLVPLERKLDFIARLAQARPSSLEVTSFVHPKKVPQLADAEELCARLRDAPWRGRIPAYGLVLNRRGLERFLASGLDGVTTVVAAQEEFSRANSGMSVDEARREIGALVDEARAAGHPVRVYLSMAFGGPRREATDPARVRDLAEELLARGTEIVGLADTVGVAEPDQVATLASSCLELAPPERFCLHMHDTYGRAVENCARGMDLGLRDFDSAAGGTGGCPFAPGAAGNLATGALLALAKDRGLPTGMDADAVDGAVGALADVLGRPLAVGAERGPIADTEPDHD